MSQIQRRLGGMAYIGLLLASMIACEGTDAAPKNAETAATMAAPPAKLEIVISQRPVARKPAAVRIFVHLVNISDEEQRIWLPGLIGPNFTSVMGAPTAVPDETRIRPRGDQSDFVVLRPGESVGRSVICPADAKVGISAFYNAFEPGKEGRSTFIKDTIFGHEELPELVRDPTTHAAAR